MLVEVLQLRLWLGAGLLLVLSLLNGAVLDIFTNPRAALSAHLTGIDGALLLFAFGAVWPRLTLPDSQARLAGLLALVGMYGLWAAFLFAAALGTSGATPISGAGHRGSPWAEMLVTAIVYVAAVSSLVGSLIVCVGLWRSHRGKVV